MICVVVISRLLQTTLFTLHLHEKTLFTITGDQMTHISCEVETNWSS